MMNSLMASGDYLEVVPDEFAQLFNTILINVTSFFRDPPAWEYLAEQIIPRIIDSKKPDDPIRIWSAGCASGEEPYTLAMVAAEALGVDAPISHIDLLVCRNVLMYFNSDAQAHIVTRFSFALQDGGFLFLGKAELLLAHSDVVAAVDLKRRVFSKVPHATLRGRLLVFANRGEGENLPCPGGTTASGRPPSRPVRKPNWWWTPPGSW
jgi:chemotaxis methyl-accepting protein methylase